ncbi:hypothetical protein VTN49DRAFT_921 [Thermomyces lanuginosus]|uniref:uncharacterized protein n=1 Tax=Thermomyces lanuginosus TaxID=5541 RepID=UPI003743A833
MRRYTPTTSPAKLHLHFSNNHHHAAADRERGIEDDPFPSSMAPNQSSSPSTAVTLSTPKPEPASHDPRHSRLRDPATWDTFSTVSYLIFFSILGTLARLGLQSLTTYPNAPVTTGVLWANVAGCVVMGLLVELRPKPVASATQNNNDHNNTAGGGDRNGSKRSTASMIMPLYVGLTTGFCGSTTSFSSFARDMFLALANELPEDSMGHIRSRGRGDSVMAIAAVIALTIGMSIAGLYLGGHAAMVLRATLRQSIPGGSLIRLIIPLGVVLGWTSWLAALLLSIFLAPSSQNYWRSSVLFALVFAPPGCLLRYYVSRWLNPRQKSFPLGTFAVNIFGTLVLGVCLDLQHVPPVVRAYAACHVLQGVMDGFCGCLTTVSTFVVEITSLSRRRDGYVYAGGSIMVALAVMVIVAGSLRWTRGWEDASCST